MIAEKSNSVLSQCFKWVSSVATLGALSASLYAATVPVVESQPVIRGEGSPQAIVRSAATVGINVSQAESNGSEHRGGLKGDSPQVDSKIADSTAHFLNMIEQLRQEVMELRGVVEEQQFQVNRLQQESRDRYLDLDDRISRIKVGEAPRSTPSSTGNQQQPPAKTIDESLLSRDSDSKGKQMATAEEKAYQAAFQLIRDRKFDESKVALRRLLVDYPNGHYSDNARYWLGEVQMAQGNYPEAVKTFEQVLKDYPRSGKIADATYKLGRLHDLLGDKKKARELLEEVIKKHSDTAAARLADTYLRSM